MMAKGRHVVVFEDRARPGSFYPGVLTRWRIQLYRVGRRRRTAYPTFFPEENDTDEEYFHKFEDAKAFAARNLQILFERDLAGET